MIRLRGMERRAGESVACLALASVFLPELSLLRTRRLDGCSCQVRMALSICRRVESLMPRAEGRRHETLAEAEPQAGTPGTFRNRGKASACTAGGQTGGSAQVLEYMPTQAGIT